jgi:hypothetical protein
MLALTMMINFLVFVLRMDFARNFVCVAFSLGIGLVILVFLPISFVLVFVVHQVWWYQLIVGLLLIMMILMLAFDTSNIAYRYSPEDCIIASITLYTDCMLIFMYALGLSGIR